MQVLRVKILLLLIWCPALGRADEMTVYQLLAPSTHAFDIIYDTSATREGSPYYFNPIREGSVATKERVIDRATGKLLTFDVVDGRAAKASEFGPKDATDGSHYLRVKLAKPVAANSETRIRIFKTYTDAPSYYEKGDGFVFDRPLGVKRNVVVLPKGYEVVGTGSPAIVSTDADGRVRVSFLNDRDDQLPVKIVGRKLP
jgi:hypothetical protein